MKIAIFAFLMVIVLTLVESHYKMSGWGRVRVRGHVPRHRGLIRQERDLNNKLAQRDLGNGQNRYTRDVNKKHHVHMSYERVPATRVARNAQTLKNVHERAFAETEDAGR
jgi:hypothetical protein